ncbi:copper resistance D family protein [Paenibacillus luteus]|uniref:copper resistance D family protein n=1 Tax=Paenibacillus luteus TaxID=2545753 RepID=UPI0013760F93|nr:CopD family protein [Paenibacillus luteus]
MKETIKRARPIGWTNGLAAALLILLVTALGSLLLPSQALAEPLTGSVAAAFDPHEQVGHTHSSEHGSDEGITVGQVLFFAIRAVYYLAFMFVSGIMLWSIVIPMNEDSNARKLFGKWEIYALRAFLLAVLLFVFKHITELLKGYGGGSPNEWLRLLTETATGHSWLAILVLSLLGFAVVRLPDSFKIIWALLLAAAESFNGHVMALPDYTFAVVFDFIHMASSAIWAGGLLLLLLFWRADRKEAGRFAERFTKIAWLTILLLTVSGIAMTALMLPSWRYLFYTNWGLLLLAKALFVLLIAVAGFFLRRRAKKGKLPSGKLLKLDGLLMALVLIVASIFTYVSPEPATEPFSHHQMGDKLHYTLEIKPNGPGPNRVTLKIWLPEQLGAPASVRLLLHSKDHPKRAAIEVPLQAASGENYLSFPGFTETDYESDKVELPTRGEWEAELLITDQSGAETKQIIAFRND